jgi:AraC-like DNA-binding protein
MANSPLNVTPTPPAIRHRIRGTHHVDAAVASIEVLMHRFVSLEEWSLHSAANAFWRLYWPTSRGGVITFDGADYELVPGCLYLISPHTAFDSECPQPFSKWYLHFNAGGLPQDCRPGIVKLRPTARIRKLLDATCPKDKRSKSSAEPAIHPLESLGLVLLVLQQSLPQFAAESNADSRLPGCIDYLQNHMQEKVTLAELARFAGISPRTLSQLFVTKLGFLPMRYLIELRLNQAIKLLRHTDHSIEQIAAECGFPNRYYFTRMLSKYRKTTPAAFRRSNRGV